ncbi:MAG: trypsin-like peptidase domain-containing protein [Synergistaceae bacterium]|nr:trypsin-like peptidase domain-containing protein [Synergistaceae bacterium]MBP9958528.1 trypsin-like peptidase domain-containing protein [Synergistaceae bacterium]
MPNLAPWEQEEQELWKKQEQAQTISADEPVASDVAAVSDPVPWEQDEQERWQPQKKNIDQPVAEDAFVPEKPQSTRRLYYLFLPFVLLIFVGLAFSFRIGTSAVNSTLQQETKDNSGHPGWVTPTGPRLTPAEILKKASVSVVTVYAQSDDEKGNRGTGFFVDGGGHVLTNFHVIEDSRQMFIQMKDERIYPVIRIVAQAPQWDLALLEVSMPIQDSVPLSIATGIPPISSDVSVVGTPKGMPHILSTGALTAVKGTDLEMIQISAPISPGFSGSPIFNDRGGVIGIATHGAETKGKSIGLGASGLVIGRFLKEKPILKKETSLTFDTEQGLLPNGGYRAYTIVPDLTVRAEHSNRSAIVEVLPKKSKVMVKREWIETDRHAARLTRNITVKVQGKTDIDFKKGEAVHILNPEMRGSGIIVLLWHNGEELQIVLDEGEIDRLYQKTWCQVILPSGAFGWVLKHDLKI